MVKHGRIQKIFSGWVQSPRRGLTENFNMAKINNLAIPWGSGPPVPPSGSAHVKVFTLYIRVHQIINFCHVFAAFHWKSIVTVLVMFGAE